MDTSLTYPLNKQHFAGFTAWNDPTHPDSFAPLHIQDQSNEVDINFIHKRKRVKVRKPQGFVVNRNHVIGH